METATPLRPEPSGFQRYGEIIRLVGAPYTALIFLARLPMAMTIFGSITFVAHTRGSIADAGLVSAALALTTALVQPLIGRWTQAAGQRLPLLLLLPIAVASLLGLVAAGRADAPLGVLVALGALTGATTMPIGGLSRVRWGSVLRGQRQNHAAMSLESMGEEITFVLGPALVGVLSAVSGPGLALVVDAVAQLVLVPLFALHPLAPGPGGNRPRGGRGMSMGRALGYVWAPVASIVMVGVYFGSKQTAVAAVTAALGAPSASGLVYAVMGLGSATSALAAVLLPDSVTLRTRLAVSALGMGAAATAESLLGRLDGTTALVALVTLMALAGFSVGVALVTVYALIGDQAPASGAAVAMTAGSAATTLGVALGTSLGGRVAQGVAPTAAFLVAAGACALLLVLALAPAHRSAEPADGQVG